VLSTDAFHTIIFKVASMPDLLGSPQNPYTNNWFDAPSYSATVAAGIMIILATPGSRMAVAFSTASFLIYGSAIRIARKALKT
jgi:hypothetical protein